MDAVRAFALRHLSGIKRSSGESYAKHCAEVAEVLLECGDNPSLHRVALLHDLLVHPAGETLLEQSPLAPEERMLVRGMHRLRKLHIDANVRDLDTVVREISADGRLLLLRIAHRLNDVRHIDRFATDRRKAIASETLHMYSALAGRMGMNVWRYRMEDPCFRIVNPRAALQLEKKFKQVRRTDLICLKQSADFLKKKLEENGIESDIRHRIKGLYSAYRKMVLKNRTFDELTDRLALRIIVRSDLDCYKALGVVHSLMHPIPGKLKDYIGAPKENGYRSVHTVVYPLPGVTEQPMELQIRTRAMHDECEFGIACHAGYKEYMYALQSRPARVNLFRNLQQLSERTESPEQFETALRKYFSEDHMAVFDPENNLYHLRKPATVLDFACVTQAAKVEKLTGALLNGRRCDIDRKLQDGDVVELRFGSKKTVCIDWVQIAHHRGSRRLIHSLVG